MVINAGEGSQVLVHAASMAVVRFSGCFGCQKMHY